jgi:hypothetical protein
MMPCDYIGARGTHFVAAREHSLTVTVHAESRAHRGPLPSLACQTPVTAADAEQRGSASYTWTDVIAQGVMHVVRMHETLAALMAELHNPKLEKSCTRARLGPAT